MRRPSVAVKRSVSRPRKLDAVEDGNGQRRMRLIYGVQEFQYTQETFRVIMAMREHTRR